MRRVNEVVHVGSRYGILHCDSCTRFSQLLNGVLVCVAVIYPWVESGWEVWNGMYPTILGNVLTTLTVAVRLLRRSPWMEYICFVIHGCCDHDTC